MKYCILFTLFIQAATANTHLSEVTKELAVKSMESQIVKLKEGNFYKAGDNQFNTLWTRDFGYSIEALLFHDKDIVVRDHLSFLLNHISKQGLLPLYADSTQPMIRVALASLRVLMPVIPAPKLKSPLKVHYKVSGRYPVIDSNALVIIGSALYLEKTNDLEFLNRHRTHLLQALNYYKKKMSPDGFIFQDSFSDWQDSAKREGEIFLTQLLYWKAATMLEDVTKEELIDGDAFKEKVKEHFFNKKLGLFVIDPKSKVERRALEDQLIAIRYKLVNDEEAIKLYDTLKNDPLWTISGPGRPSYPEYKEDEINWYVKLSGVNDYHGPLHWSWLWGLTGLVAHEMNDQTTVLSMAKRIDKVLLRDGVVGEVYSPEKNYPLFKSRLYRSEKPFGWGSAFIAHFYSLKN